MTQTEPEETNGLNRRTFLKGTAATAGIGAASTAAPPRYSPIGRAQAIAPLIGFAAGAVGLHYLMEEAYDAYVGDDGDYSGYTGADALHLALEEAALEMESADERVMTSIQNNITNSANVAMAKGKAALIEQMNDGVDVATAKEAMNDAIDGYYAIIEENILNHYKAQVNQVFHHGEEVDNHADLYLADVFEVLTNGDPDQWYDYSTSTNSKEKVPSFLLHQDSSYTEARHESYTLLDGSEVTDVPVVIADGEYTTTLCPHDSMQPDTNEWSGVFVQYRIYDSGGGDSVTHYMDAQRFHDTMESLYTERDDVNAQLNGFADDVYDAYEPGEIPTEDLVDPITASTELAQNYDHYSSRAAHAAMLGIPTDADLSVQMTLEESGYTVWADLYTNHVPTDADGNEVGFTSGSTYSPGSWSEPLYIAYEYQEQTCEEDGVDNTSSDDCTVTSETYSDFTQIEEDFTIEFVEDRDGNEVTEFQTKSQTSQTSDVATLEEELAKIRETQIQMQEDAEEDINSGGGGGFFDGTDLPGEGVLLVAVAVAAFLYGK